MKIIRSYGIGAASSAEKVTLLAMGSVNGPDKEEDLACQDYMWRTLTDKSVDKNETIRQVVESPAGRLAMDPSIDWKTPGDLECATAIDRFKFAMPVFRENDMLIARATFKSKI